MKGIKYLAGGIAICLMTLALSDLNAQNSEKAYDVTSVDGIITALYQSISGEKGEPRNWEMFNDLFSPDAKLIPTGKDDKGKTNYGYWTPAEYKGQAEAYLVENGFHEIEIYRVTESYGPILHLFSTYESRNSIKDEEPFNRGINSIQLLFDGERWWIMNIFWSHETKENPIPAKYLPG